MYKLISILLITLTLASCGELCKRPHIHYDKFTNVQITSVYNFNDSFQEVYYWDLSDTTNYIRKRCLIDEIYKDSLIVGKRY